MADNVAYFLEEYLMSNKIEQLSIPTIKNLLFLYLDHNIFYYQDKIYRYEKGYPDTMPLSDIVSDIYIFKWQKKILEQSTLSKELFGR